MTLEQFSRNVDKALQEFDTVALRAGQIAAKDLAALVAFRVRQKGENSEGGQFSGYSTVPVPAYLYVGKSRSGGADNRVKQLAKEKQSISYRDFRVINGLKASPKNFEFTGEMWRSFDGSAQLRGSILRITLDAKRADLQKRIDHLSKQEGSNIVEVSSEETQDVAVLLGQTLVKLILNG